MITSDHFHLESLEKFTTDLVSVGFQPVPGSSPPRWTGSIHPAFKPLTDAVTMDIVIVPGWPFQPPALIVQGLNTNHSTLDGLVCMWQVGDFSHKWTTVSGLFSRIKEWCDQAQHGWKEDHLELDAFLNYHSKFPLVATFNLETLGVSKGGMGSFHGIVSLEPLKMDLAKGPRREANQLRGMWIHVGTLEKPPPRQLSEVSLHLRRHQHRGLYRALSERQNPDLLIASGGVDLILFCWERNSRIDLLVLACKGVGEQVEAVAIQPGPNDEQSLVLRAGPDASVLYSCRTVVFGAGSLGGHTAMLLAESGVGHLGLVDADVLLPGNVVRHVAGHQQVGAPKVDAVQAVIADHASWTTVANFQESPRTPDAMRKRIEGADIVIDTTGNEATTCSLAMVAQDIGIPFVSGALYRGGFIGRMQRQANSNDMPINLRENLDHYPVIPAGDDNEDYAVPQLGCSAPINNASPVAVSACASLIAHAAVDVLTKRFELADEVIDVYRPIPDPPFNRIGRIDHNVM